MRRFQRSTKVSRLAGFRARAWALAPLMVPFGCGGDEVLVRIPAGSGSPVDHVSALVLFIGLIWGVYLFVTRPSEFFDGTD